MILGLLIKAFEIWIGVSPWDKKLPLTIEILKFFEEKHSSDIRVQMFPFIGHCDIICFTPKISFDIRKIERYRQIERIQERAQTSELFESVVRVGSV